MSRKHYTMIAASIADILKYNTVNAGERVAVKITAQAIADAMASDNPRFNRAKFLTACGL